MTIAAEVQTAEIPANGTPPLLEARALKKHFPVTKGLLFSRTTGYLKAVDGVSFQVERGKTLGIVGNRAAAKALPPS